MNTSETYIKMCERAVEVQNNRVYDFDARINRGIVLHGSGDLYYCDQSVVWLPRQDQLQEMISSELWRLTGLIAEMEEFGGYPFGLWHGDVLTSMEQLWLAFTMKEKFGKIWTGSDWQLQ